jgi:MFS family permease
VGLAGAALATISATLIADRVGRRSFLLILSLLSSVAGIGLAISASLPVLAILTFVGMLNGTGTDRSAASAIDQAVIPGLVPDARRTWNLAWWICKPEVEEESHPQKTVELRNLRENARLTFHQSSQRRTR